MPSRNSAGTNFVPVPRPHPSRPMMELLENRVLWAATPSPIVAAAMFAGPRVSSLTAQSVPDAPADVRAYAASATQIDLLWDDAAGPATYEIERAAGTESFSPLAAVGPRVARYSDRSATFGQPYRYRVRAVTAGGTSDYSAEVTASVLPPELTVAVKQLPALPSVGRQVQLNLSAVVPVGTTGFFLVADGGPETARVSTAQVWTTDGTAAGTRLVKDIGDGYPQAAGAAGGLFYFTITDHSGLTRLWRSDGTDGGTIPLRDLYTVDFGSAANPTTEGARDVNGTFYFDVVGHPFGPRVRYMSDGTAAGTVPAADPVPEPPPARDPFRVAVGDTTVYWESTVWSPDGHTRYNDIYVTDGTEAGTTLLRRFDYGGAPGVTNLEAVGGRVYFTIVADSGRSELWRTDLTPDTTALVKTLPAGAGRLSSVNGRLTFTDGQLWSSDGTDAGTTQISDIGYGSLPAHPDWLTTAGNLVYFTSSYDTRAGNPDPGDFGRELWRSDGTAAGTVKLYSGRVRDLTAVDGTLYFAGYDAANGDELWKSDGTAAGTVRVADVVPGTDSSSPRLLGAVGGTLLFGVPAAASPGGYELWRTDGTAAGTVPVPGPLVYLEPAHPVRDQVAVSHGRLFFQPAAPGLAYPAPRPELWQTDGTAGGTEQVAGVGGEGYAVATADVAGKLYLVSTNTAGSQTDLAVVSTTAPQATPVKTIPGGVGARSLVAVGDKLFFVDTSTFDVARLWRSDGTAAGTFAVGDLPANPLSFGSHLAAAGGAAYVVTYRQEEADESGTGAAGIRATLWRADGTAGGTVAVRDFLVDPATFPFGGTRSLTAAGSLVFYSDGTRLWRSDGTTAGTVIVDESAPPAYPLYGAGAVVAGDGFYYAAAAAGGGRELRVASTTPPAAPTGLVTGGEPAADVSAFRTFALAAAAGTRLTWADHSAHETGFVVERSPTADFAAVDRTYFAPADATSLVVATGGAAATTHYRVRAVNAAGSSAFAYDAPVPPPAATTLSLRSPADAHVRDGTYAGQNFGAAGTLEVRKSSTAGNQREAYVRFDLSQVASASLVASAKVRVFGKLSAAGSIPVGLYAVSGTGWTEAGVKWSNRPAAAASPVGTKTVASAAGGWFEFDVTSYLKQQKQAGAKAVSFALKATAYSTPVVQFNSDEAAANRPELRVVQGPPTPTPQAVVLSAPAAAVGEGKTAAVTVRLAARPAANVVVTVARSAGDGDLTAGPLKFTFTPADWATARTVTLAAAPDADTADGSATFSFAAAGLSARTLTATEADDDRVLRAAADGYARDGGSAATNYGSAATLAVQRSAVVGSTRWTVLKFDLAQVPTVSSAVLRLNGRVESAAAASVRVQAFAATATAWTEAGVTWQNKPAPAGPSLGEVVVAGTTAKWYQIDLTAWLKAQRAAGKTTASLVLTSPAATGAAAVFASDEAPTNRPELAVTG